jgi:hypothetical protein
LNEPSSDGFQGEGIVERPKSITRRLAMIGSAALVVGGTLLGAAIVAGASGPAISLSLVPPGGFPNSGSTTIEVSGTGFTAKVRPWILECDVEVSGSGEPTMSVPAVTGNKAVTLTGVPVGCSPPSETPSATNAAGDMVATAFTVVPGTVGPPAPGNDSTGASGATDAPNYPCPEYLDQASTNVCQIEVIEPNLDMATAPLSFVDSTTPNTTTTSSTTTTTAPCNASNGQITAPITGVTTGSGTATVDQPGGAAPTSNPQAATCLLGGDVVQVAATGTSVGNGGAASILECNTDPSQPTVKFLSSQIPVSCTDVTKYLIAMTSNSFPSTAFTIVQGVTGPPTTGIDTAGNQATTDAQNYQCPPTAAELAADPSDACVIAVGTAYASGTPKTTDQLPVPISFNQNELSSGTTSNNAATAAAAQAAAAAKAAAAKKASTKASSSSLAFTGAGPGLWLLGMVGVLLMLLGGFTLVLVDAPRRFLRLAVDHGRRVRADESS